MDLVFERAGRVDMVVEIKRFTAPEASAGLRSACQVLKPRIATTNDAADGARSRPDDAERLPPRAARLADGLAATFATPAILLRAISTGEADRVVTLLGRNTGVLGAIARGARKSRRRFGGGLGLCSIGQAQLRERAGMELLTLEGFEVTRGFPSLACDVIRMGEAAYVAELLARLCAPRQIEIGIYDLARTFLDLLDAGGPSAARLRAFELRLLGHLGFAPALTACAVCGRSDLGTGDTIDVRWVPDRGGVLCRSCAARGRRMRPVVRLALARLAEGGLAEADVDPPSADVARGCREALAELIGAHLSSPLRSLEFMAKMQAAEAPRP